MTEELKGITGEGGTQENSCRAYRGWDGRFHDDIYRTKGGEKTGGNVSPGLGLIHGIGGRRKGKKKKGQGSLLWPERRVARLRGSAEVEKEAPMLDAGRGKALSEIKDKATDVREVSMQRAPGTEARRRRARTHENVGSQTDLGKHATILARPG